MKISSEELIDKDFKDGYRLIYFYGDDVYHVGEFCKTIEGFMIGFVEYDPIVDEDDIPTFVSIEDILDRCLDSMKDISGVAIYKTDGTCVEMKKREEIYLYNHLQN